jgi:GH25 family lysozyme M1 (1,4-beta-N-acetylmuramidase)
MTIRLSLAATLIAVLLAAPGVTHGADAVGGLTGPDVSSWNHVNGAAINWSAVKAAGNSFAFVKATEGPSVIGGTFYTNPYYAGDAASAHAAGLYVGSYDFAEPALPLGTAISQANAFASVIGSQHGTWQLPPVLDLEVTNGLSVANLQAWVQTWLTQVTHLTGRTPMIYTSPSFWKTYMGNTTSMSGYRLWLASWTTAATPGTPPGGWSTWTMWQYTDAATVAGIPGKTDLSRYCCTSGSLAALANGSDDLAAGNPFGAFDTATRAPGTITVSGWAIDPDTTDAIQVDVWVDGKWAGKTDTGVTRNDVGVAYPAWGDQRGYTTSVPVAAGTHTVCTYAINSGNGDRNPLLGCKTLSGDPTGDITSFTPINGGVNVAGWLQDPDSATPESAQILVDGLYRTTVTGGPVNFTQGMGSLADGSHRFCLWGIDTQGLVPNVSLGCHYFTMTGEPFGHFESATEDGTTVTASGWAIDPNTTAPIQVNLYVDGKWTAATTAGVDRPDVGLAYPTSGALHGFSASLTVAAGPHTVCAYAINTGLGGANRSLGCHSVG